MENTRGFLEVGISEDSREVIVNHPDLKPDAAGVGHIVFSPRQARNLARLLDAKADEIEPCSSDVEVGWLLDDGRLCLGFCNGRRIVLVCYTDSAAIRFARECDAKNFRRVMLPAIGLSKLSESVAPIEHMWL